MDRICNAATKVHVSANLTASSKEEQIVSYYNGQPIPLGLKMSDLNPRPKWLDDSMAARGFNVGDLVMHRTMSYNSMVIYRIIEYHQCNGNLVWSEYKPYKRSTCMSRGWTDPVTGKVPNRRLIYGHLVLVPVFGMEEGRLRKKNIPYNEVFRLKKVDILELGRIFSRLNDFVMSEAKRLSE